MQPCREPVSVMTLGVETVLAVLRADACGNRVYVWSSQTPSGLARRDALHVAELLERVGVVDDSPN